MRTAFLAAQHRSFSIWVRQSLRSNSAYPQHPFPPLQRPWRGNGQYRGAKIKATVQLRDLPQGPLGGQQTLVEVENEAPAYPPVVQQAWNNMQKFEGCVVLTRVGSFYEVCPGAHTGLLKIAKHRHSFIWIRQTNMAHFSILRWLKRRPQRA